MVDREPQLPNKKMKTMFLSNMSKSRRLTSTFFPIRGFVRSSVTLELKMQKTRIYDAAVGIICECVRGVRGVAGGWMPLPTRPQRYYDPVSLVHFNVQYFLV